MSVDHELPPFTQEEIMAMINEDPVQSEQLLDKLSADPYLRAADPNEIILEHGADAIDRLKYFGKVILDPRFDSLLDFDKSTWDAALADPENKARMAEFHRRDNNLISAAFKNITPRYVVHDDRKHTEQLESLMRIEGAPIKNERLASLHAILLKTAARTAIENAPAPARPIDISVARTLKRSAS